MNGQLTVTGLEGVDENAVLDRFQEFGDVCAIEKVEPGEFSLVYRERSSAIDAQMVLDQTSLFGMTMTVRAASNGRTADQEITDIRRMVAEADKNISTPYREHASLRQSGVKSPSSKAPAKWNGNRKMFQKKRRGQHFRRQQGSKP